MIKTNVTLLQRVTINLVHMSADVKKDTEVMDSIAR